MKIEGLSELVGTDLIQETFLFKFLNFDETIELARIISREDRPKGQTIIEEGALGQALYLVESGRVKVYKGEGRAREELAVLGEGEMFGEMSLIEDELTSASVVADTKVTLLVIKRKDLESLMEGNLEVALKIYKTFCHTLSERLRRTSGELSRYKAKYDDAGTGGRAGKPASKAAAGKKVGKAKSKKTPGKKGKAR